MNNHDRISVYPGVLQSELAKNSPVKNDKSRKKHMQKWKLFRKSRHSLAKNRSHGQTLKQYIHACGARRLFHCYITRLLSQAN
jgi:hypothetical protein